MPELKLRPDVLDGPTRADLIEIETVMLWPEDDALRADRARAAEAATAVEITEKFVQRWPNLELGAEAVAMAMRRIVAAPRMADLQPEVCRRCEHGAIAGLIFETFLGYHEIDRDHAKLGAIKVEIGRRWGVSVSTIDNTIWPRFKPVVHLFAAWGSRASQLGRNYPFPCRLDDLGMFLAVAEHDRRIGEALRPRQASETLLDPATTWKVAPALASRLPAVSIAYERNRSKGS